MKDTLLQLFLDYALPPLLVALFGFVMWALAQLATWLRSREAESKLFRLTATVTDLSRSIVAELNATLRPQLAAALADGVLTDVEKAQLKSTALDVLKNKLPEGLRTLATQFFGTAVDAWLGGHIERAVVAQALPKAAP
jgi:hypothetical protein